MECVNPWNNAVWAIKLARSQNFGIKETSSKSIHCHPILVQEGFLGARLRVPDNAPHSVSSRSLVYTPGAVLKRDHRPE